MVFCIAMVISSEFVIMIIARRVLCCREITELSMLSWQ